mmetsp:Transcript_36979/g.75384  ORF Transcript_36979/g.75384 Transcript_36979/m.75384 type:complete len:617 (-) Transcript_36979:128-1978(-)|eukprot:CAMPEP_0113422726 /NCGR_PEP_ID=MMETSP0013_2-20120614/28615_1 /TAXON_ID=2843 ORGANISM="Skeletonema costatum, Strain 1716" /NCGR_SAMPLE_ID=MMETSP0013_2 /ASSEMBLY_ACC=CAM_ASM_000158 /LENGTH=616 /DNA_ID=CAMNT_0000310491 /DNA_START=156 /DNA_END=2006 /DNA_ORIENTATION=+ /assembly_acc=CAM_ASM_000158
MHQRRPNSSVIVATRNGSDSDSKSLEERRAERRLAAKQRRDGGKKLKRVKRRTIKGGKLWWRKNPQLEIACFAFGLFALIGVTMFKLLHGGGGSGGGRRRDVFKAFEKKLQEDRAAKGQPHEINTDSGGFFSRLRGSKYMIPESLKRIGNKDAWYAALRQEYDIAILPKNDERSIKFVQETRERNGAYTQIAAAQTPYDIHNCPEYPPEGYPIQWPILEVTKNWPTDDATPRHEIYQGICVFDYRTELHKADNYRKAELPFVVRDDPASARTAERWMHPGYLDKLLMGKEDIQRRTEYSPNNHFMYWVDKRSRSERQRAAKKVKDAKLHGNDDAHGGFGRGDQEEFINAMHLLDNLHEARDRFDKAKAYAQKHQDDDEAQQEVQKWDKSLRDAKKARQDEESKNWKPPTENLRMTYLEWLEHANVTDDKLGPDNPHWYFRLIGCGDMGDHTADGSCDKGSSEWLFDELTFFQPRLGERRPFYMIEPQQQKGIHCRFGMKGVIAENHFDLSRNAIALLGGQRRYILAHPNQCNNMNLLPRGHPSARHSAVDWANPDLDNFPTFPKAHVNEIVMQPGDVLYLPTNWFHYIVSLELNFQCNTRSGGERLYRKEVNDCGF